MKENNEDKLQLAIELIQDGKSVRYAERITGIANLRDKIPSIILEDSMQDGKNSDIAPKDVKLNPNRDNGKYTKCWEGTYICKPHGEDEQSFIERKQKQYGKFKKRAKKD